MHTTKESNIMPKDFYFEVRELQSVRRIYRVEAETLEEATEKAQDGETIDEIGDEIDEVMQRDIHQQIPERQYRDADDAQNNAKRYAIYDMDAEEFVTTTVYDYYDDAADDIDSRLSSAIVVEFKV